MLLLLMLMLAVMCAWGVCVPVCAVVEHYCFLKIIIDVVRRDDAVRFASAPCIFSRKNVILSSQNGRPQNVLFCCQAPVEAPRSFLPFFRSRLGFARDRKGLLSPAPQKCHPCRSSCMSQIIQKRKGNHKNHASSTSAPFFATPIALSRPRRRHFFGICFPFFVENGRVR